MWPFSVRILWAPIVDRFFSKKVGRRKTWIVSCLLLSGVLMVCFAEFVKTLVYSKREYNQYDIYALTAVFGTLVLLASTNDIAMDAWSIDLLMEYT
jgi:PAT family acetyl-CoA transporter-like MFS transporter 1